MKRLWGKEERLLWVKLSFISEVSLLKVFRLIKLICEFMIYSFLREFRLWKELGLIFGKWFFDIFSFFSFIRGVRLGIFLMLYMFKFRYLRLNSFLKVFLEIYFSFLSFFKFRRMREGIRLKV